MVSKPKPAGPAPNAVSLREAALRYLSRFFSTEAGLVRVLDRRVQSWASKAAGEGQEIASAVVAARSASRQVARSLVELGVIDDALFASTRAARLSRSGRSRKAVAAHLASKGVEPETARAVLPGLEREVSAALAYARRRRLGPFRAAEATDSPEHWRRDLGALARAGFSREIAERALQTPLDTAEALILAMKQG